MRSQPGEFQTHRVRGGGGPQGARGDMRITRYAAFCHGGAALRRRTDTGRGVARDAPATHQTCVQRWEVTAVVPGSLSTVTVPDLRRLLPTHNWPNVFNEKVTESLCGMWVLTSCVTLSDENKY